ncbi:MAG: hypothetical protein FD156_1902 [Nitrospirae bacterium]|nr:MAG: hypothetical protein FD156_1902 [Nitrospirota bacterium]
MGKFNFICPDHYPMKCNLSSPDKDYLLTPEKYKAFFIFQYRDQDKWLQPTIERYFSERTWRLFNADKEGGTGTKFCNICRYALASDFGIVSLTPLNYNVFQETGLMQGLKKPLIFLLNPGQKEKLPFDIDDQIYIEHTDAKSLLGGLDNKIPLLLDKLLLLTGFETEQKALIVEKLKSISPKAKNLLKRFVLEGKFSFRSDTGSDLDKWVDETREWKVAHLRELEVCRFIITETESGGTRTLQFKRFNEPYRKFLEELLFSATQTG